MISNHIKRNTYYTFVFNLSDADSVYRALKHLQIEPSCNRLLSSLLPGMCVFRQTQASWSNAFLCTIDFAEPPRKTEAIKYDSPIAIPAITSGHANNIIEELERLVNKNKSYQTNCKEDPIKQLALKLLKLRAENPYEPVVRLVTKLGKIRFETQQAIRTFLQKNELAEFEEPRIGRTNMLLMDITDAGFKVLGLEAPKENKGRGSITHRHFAHWIKFYFGRKDRKAFLEWVIPGTTHPVDVAVESLKHWEVFEICVTATDNLITHVEACFEQSYDIKKLTIVAGTQKKLKEIKRQIKNNLILARFQDRIELEAIKKFMK